MEQHISLVTLGVKDLARARAFYEALGWRSAQRLGAQMAHNPDWAITDDGSVRLP